MAKIKDIKPQYSKDKEIESLKYQVKKRSSDVINGMVRIIRANKKLVEEELKKLQKSKEYCGCHSEAEILAERIKNKLNEYL